MVDDLCVPIEVVGVETVREPDGLAMSSRNRYLEPDQRRSAVVLSKALFAGRAAADRGAAEVIAAASDVLASAPAVEVDYLELRGTDLGSEPGPGPARLLVAARVGTTRLIDNVGLELR
jgi:pantoate--beta-alanine ligase